VEKLTKADVMNAIRSKRRLLTRTSLVVGFVAALTAVESRSVNAIPLVDGLGGTSGYGELAMNPNDDGSSDQLSLPFDINFFGSTFDQFFINNNGNLTFNGPVSEFTPEAFPTSDRAMIAPFWGDVDTRGSGDGPAGQVFLGSGTDIAGNKFIAATWSDVSFFGSPANSGGDFEEGDFPDGEFPNEPSGDGPVALASVSQPNPTNDFQVILRERADTNVPGSTGNFDIDFRYNRLDWTTGTASGGDSNGLGGTEAQAGFDAGNNENFFTLPGSQTPDVLELQNTSNVSSETPGLWSFAIRNGGLPDGSTPSNPLLPIVNEDGFNFDFEIELNQQIFIDPVVAVGYDYVVNSGPNFASVLVPAALANGDADFLLDLGASGIHALTAGVVFNLLSFDSLGFSEFSILEISTDEALNPGDPLAFITGLTFVGAGQVNVTQSPITVDTDNGQNVPEPSSGLLVLAALAFLKRRPARRHGDAAIAV
jgi:hypothetical protein